MAENREAYRRGGQLGWQLPLLCGTVAFVVYLLTLSPGIYPGQSAQWMALCLGIDPRVVPAHPLWTLIASGIGNLHFLATPLRLNLFSALCGALSVSLVCHLTRLFVWGMIFDNPIDDRQRSRAAMLAAVTAALAFAFSVPAWSAATRLQYQSFDLLLLLLVFCLLAQYIRSGRQPYIWLFVFCYGVGIVESPLFLTLSPAAGVGTLLSLWRCRHLGHGNLLGLAHLFLLGLGVYALVAFLFLRTPDAVLHGYTGWLDVLKAMWREQYHEVRSEFPRLNWVWLLLQSVMPALAVSFAARRALNNGRTWSHYLLHLFLTVLAASVLLNASWSPWRLLEAQGLLPVAFYALMALVCGYLLAYWYLLQSMGRHRHDQRGSILMRRTGDWMGRILLWPFAALVVATSVVNGIEADGHRGRCADVCARELLQRLGSRTWLVTDGLLDNHVAILARERGQNVHLLCLPRDTDKAYQRRLAQIVHTEKMFGDNQARMLDTLKLGLLPFLQDWLASDPEVQRKMAIFSVPDLWYGAEFQPVPELLFFSGARDPARLDLGALVADHLAFWGRMEKLVPRVTDPQNPVAFFNNQLRRQMGFAGNNLGVLLEEAGRTNDADLVYQRVRQLDPDNISVLFNRFELARRGKDETRTTAAEKELKEFLEHNKRQYPLYSLSRYYGYVRSPELFARLGWLWALSGQTGASLVGLRKAVDLLPPDSQISLERTKAAIYLLQDDRIRTEEIYRGILEKNPQDQQAMQGMARLALSTGSLEKAKSWLEKIQKTGVTQNRLGVEWAAIHLAAGENALAATNVAAATASFAQARMQLQETVDLEANNLQALGMLALAQLQQAAVERAAQRDPKQYFREVGQTIDRMDKIAGTPNQYFAQIVRAQLAMASGKEKENYRAAREAFLRARALQPGMTKLNDVILQLDIALADQSQAEQHAQDVLRVNRRHALANYVIGSLRLQSGDYGEAEDFLRRSVESEPLPVALNDLAETLRRVHRFAEAERLAREATGKAPSLYIAWETLAAVLMDQNRLPEAQVAMHEALLRNSNDMRLRMSAARLQYLQGDLNQAQENIKLVRKNISQLNEYERGEFEKLAKSVSQRR